MGGEMRARKATNDSVREGGLVNLESALLQAVIVVKVLVVVVVKLSESNTGSALAQKQGGTTRRAHIKIVSIDLLELDDLERVEITIIHLIEVEVKGGEVVDLWRIVLSMPVEG